MLNVSREAKTHVIPHVTDHEISKNWYQKDVQMFYLNELIIILNKSNLIKTIIDLKL